ncbi:MAG: hydroxyacid dehydrogenase [Alphaproteobacteria bacterium]|nr:hydroxyacid dehydrogenase [Alphaproteobacteria bacterium]
MSTWKTPMRVVRTSLWIDPIYDQLMKAEADIALSVMDIKGPETSAWALLERAHVYQIAATKDDLPRPYFAQQALIERCPELLIVSSNGAGFDTVDAQACTDAGILVVNQSGGNARSVAEHTFGLMLGLSRRMIECDRKMHRSNPLTREEVMGHEITGKTLGLVGIGQVGRQVARIAAIFDMKVLACDPGVEPDEIRRRGAEPVSLDELLARSDVVSLHCPRDASTLRMMNAQRFAQMKRGAMFITTARGGIHDEAALTEALKSGHLSGAGLDVWDQEPPPAQHPLLALDNVYATFHTAGVTHEARRTVASMGASQLIEWKNTLQAPPRCANPQAWPAHLQRRKAVLGF